MATSNHVLVVHSTRNLSTFSVKRPGVHILTDGRAGQKKSPKLRGSLIFLQGNTNLSVHERGLFLFSLGKTSGN